MGIEDIDMRAVLEAAFEREKHPYVNPDAGHPTILQRIGASCMRCGLPGGHPIHRPEAHQ